MNGVNDVVLLFVPIFGSIVLVFVLSRLIVSSADESRRAREIGDGQFEFAPNKRNYIAAVLFVGYLVYVSISLVVTGLSTAAGEIGTALWLAIVLFLLAAFPGSIVVGDQGLQQKYWLRKKRMAWKDVGKVVLDEKRNRVTIAGRGGIKIVFMRQLPDKARLMAELGRHCPDKVPADAKQNAVVAVS